MLPACNQGAGISQGFPDVCLTPAPPGPPVPIPYPNIAMHAMAAPACVTILLSGLPALNMGSIIPMTMGMEPGVANPLYMQLGMFTMGVPTVLLEGLPAVTLTSPTMGNAGNNPVGMVVATSVTNVLYARAPAGAVGGRGVEDVTRPEGGHARVGVGVFEFGVASAVRAELSKAGDSVVLDLRGNPGGEVDACVDLLRGLLPAGALLARLIDNDGDTTTYRARGDDYGGRITVLVDGGTASAAELFAGCLQAHGRARIVGERTYGKSLVTASVPSGENGQVARFLLPDGRDVQGMGIEPDEPLRWV